MNPTYNMKNYWFFLVAIMLLLCPYDAKADKGYVSVSPAADASQNIIVAKDGSVTFSVISGEDTITSCSGSFENTGGTFDGSFSTTKTVTFGASAEGKTSTCTITISTTGSTGETCSTSVPITFHVIVPKVTIDSFAVCSGKQAVTLDLLPVVPAVTGTLSVSLTSSGGDTQVINLPGQVGKSGLNPSLDFTKFPTSLTSWSTVKAKWTLKGTDYKAPDFSSSLSSMQMNCTGYYTALNSAFSGGGGTFWVGATSFAVNQSFLDAIVRVSGGSVQVLEGVGVLTAGSGVYYHFAASDQVLSADHTHITKYVATSNGADGNCSGGHALVAGVSVAKKDSSLYFSCGTNLYIANNDGSVSSVCHTVQDSGHDIDTPDIFNGQGNATLDTGPGNEIVMW
jgi:hypothetical protein